MVSQPSWASYRETRNEQPAPGRAEILGAARAVFARQGYSSTTVSDIAGEAGVSRPAFYMWFGSKEEVFRVLAETLRDELTAVQRSPDLDFEAAPLRSAVMALQSAMRFFATNLGLWRAIVGQASVNPSVAELIEVVNEGPLRRHAAFIARVQGPVGPEEIDPLLIAGSVESVIRYYAELLAEGRRSDAELTTALGRLYIRLVGRWSEAELVGVLADMGVAPADPPGRKARKERRRSPHG